VPRVATPSARPPRNRPVNSIDCELHRAVTRPGDGAPAGRAGLDPGSWLWSYRARRSAAPCPGAAAAGGLAHPPGAASPGATADRVVRLGQLVPVRGADVSGEVYLLSYAQRASGPQFSLFATAHRPPAPPGPRHPGPVVPPVARAGSSAVARPDPPAPAPVSRPAPVARLRGAAGRGTARRLAFRASGGQLPPGRGCVAGGGAGRTFGGYHDEFHAARRPDHGHPVRLGRSRPGAVAADPRQDRSRRAQRRAGAPVRAFGSGGGDREIGTPDAPVRSLVIAAREDIEIARQVRKVLRS
jgi:hypothetical protein